MYFTKGRPKVIMRREIWEGQVASLRRKRKNLSAFFSGSSQEIGEVRANAEQTRGLPYAMGNTQWSYTT